MGQASSIVNGPGAPAPKSPLAPPPKQSIPFGATPPKSTQTDQHGGVIRQLVHITDDLDLAISTKEHDLQHEGHSLAAENHYKLGILRGATALIRRAKAILEDYNRVLAPDSNTNDLEEDIDIAIAAQGQGTVDPDEDAEDIPDADTP